MPVGRKPKPTAVHRLNGNPSKLNLDGRSEAQPDVAAAQPDAALSDATQAEIKRLSARLAALGIITELDHTVFNLLGPELDKWSEANRRIREDGLVVETPNGYLQPSPYINIAEKAMKQILKILTEYGCTPSSRSRIAVKQENDSEDARFFGSR